MGFSRQEYWSGLPFPSSGDLPNPGIQPASPALQADSLWSEPQGRSLIGLRISKRKKEGNFFLYLLNWRAKLTHTWWYQKVTDSNLVYWEIVENHPKSETKVLSLWYEDRWLSLGWGWGADFRGQATFSVSFFLSQSKALKGWFRGPVNLWHLCGATGPGNLCENKSGLAGETMLWGPTAGLPWWKLRVLKVIHGSSLGSLRNHIHLWMRHNCKIKEPLCSTPTDQAGQGLWPLCDLGLPHWVAHGHICISQLELHN